MYGFETFTSLLANRTRPRESVMTRCVQLDSGQCGQCGQCGVEEAELLTVRPGGALGEELRCQVAV